MFIREIKKKNANNGKVFYQYQLTHASCINGKVKQNQVLYLGSDTELNDKKVRQEVLEQLQSKIFRLSLLYNDYSKVSQKLAEKYPELLQKQVLLQIIWRCGCLNAYL